MREGHRGGWKKRRKKKVRGGHKEKVEMGRGHKKLRKKKEKKQKDFSLLDWVEYK